MHSGIHALSTHIDQVDCPANCTSCVIVPGQSALRCHNCTDGFEVTSDGTGCASLDSNGGSNTSPASALPFWYALLIVGGVVVLVVLVYICLELVNAKARNMRIVPVLFGLLDLAADVVNTV